MWGSDNTVPRTALSRGQEDFRETQAHPAFRKKLRVQGVLPFILLIKKPVSFPWNNGGAPSS